MKKWIRKRGLLLTCILLVVTLIGVVGIQVTDRTNEGLVNIGSGEKVITIGNIAYAAGTLDYTYDGVADDVQFQAALNALPATGGRLVVVSTGTINFSNPVTRAIDNVVI